MVDKKWRSNQTAEEFQAQLHADPEWVRRKAERDAYWKEVEARYREEERVLLSELKAVGIDAPSIDVLVKRKEPYPQAIPILLRHLRMPYSDNFREQIARCLAIPDAAYVRDELIAELFKEERAPLRENKIKNVAQGLACAVAASTTEANIPSLVALVKDESLGSNRILFLRRLRRSKRPEASEVLRDLKDDPTFSKEINSWRGAAKKKVG